MRAEPVEDSKPAEDEDEVVEELRPAAGEPAEPVGMSIDGLDDAGRRRLRRGWWGGAGPVLALYTWVLTAGRANLFQSRERYHDFFDAQGHAFFDGRLDIPPEVAQWEGFEIDGKTHIYFGPFPTLIRLPILAVTSHYDGRLTTLSMLAAMVVLAVAAFRLGCALRATVRGSAPVSRREVWAHAPLAVATLLAPPFFLASATLVFHEAAIWGVALTVASFDAIVRWQRDPTRRRLVIAALLVALALLSRQAIALGPTVGLALAGAAWLLRRYRQRRQAHPPTRLVQRLGALAPAAGGIALAVTLAVLPSVAIHYAKFGQVLGVPIDRQVISRNLVAQGGARAEVLEANPTFQGFEYASTTAWQYFRPDAVALRRDFPWIDFPRTGPRVVDDDVVFDTLDWSSSIPTTAPALTVLSLVGLVWSVRTWRQRFNARSTNPPLYPLALGAVASGVGVVAFAYVANRYLSDLFPLVLVGGLIGFHVLVASSPGRSTWVRRVAFGGLGALVGLGAVINLTLTLQYQRERGHLVPQEWLAEWVSWRVQLPGSQTVLHLSPDEPFSTGPNGAQPPVADGALLVIGDCEKLYSGMRAEWLLVEGTREDEEEDQDREEEPDAPICRSLTD